MIDWSDKSKNKRNAKNSTGHQETQQSGPKSLQGTFLLRLHPPRCLPRTQNRRLEQLHQPTTTHVKLPAHKQLLMISVSFYFSHTQFFCVLINETFLMFFSVLHYVRFVLIVNSFIVFFGALNSRATETFKLIHKQSKHSLKLQNILFQKEIGFKFR